MNTWAWERALVPEENPDLLWELFHENSKTGRYDDFPSNDVVFAEMKDIAPSLEFSAFQKIELPEALALERMSLSEAMTNRITARQMVRTPITLQKVATLLRLGYGVTRGNEDGRYPRPFRTIPSGGALYPLEIFLHAGNVEGLARGLYHFNASENHLRFLRNEDLTSGIASALVQSEIATQASLILFVTALFERTIFKYSDRGYRFIFLEAGHLAQNVNLAATALGLGATNVGGFFDREIDRLLHLDGITHSTIYMIAIGGQSQSQPETA